MLTFIINKVKKRKRDDTGASSVVEFLFALVMLLIITITILDLGIFFSNKSIITNSAQNGARLVSIYGGVGSNGEGTSISKNYASSVSEADKEYYSKLIGDSSKLNSVTINIIKELEKSSLVNVTINSVECGPDFTEKLGQRTYCTVKWQYRGIPGSASSLINNSKEQTSTVSAESEVVLTK